jgi:hypothetical protein
MAADGGTDGGLNELVGGSGKGEREALRLVNPPFYTTTIYLPSTP